MLEFIVHGIIYNILVSSALLLLVARNPRYMMQDYPPDVTAHVPPRTPGEKRGALIWGMPFLLILTLYPLVLSIVLRFCSGYEWYQSALLAFILYFSFNLVDWLVLDWLIFCTITPRFMVLPGTEGHPGYKNYRFHFFGFLKGLLFTLAAGVLTLALTEAAALLSWVFTGNRLYR